MENIEMIIHPKSIDINTKVIGVNLVAGAQLVVLDDPDGESLAFAQKSVGPNDLLIVVRHNAEPK